jgi:hypothetical protein
VHWPSIVQAEPFAAPPPVLDELDVELELVEVELELVEDVDPVAVVEPLVLPVVVIVDDVVIPPVPVAAMPPVLDEVDPVCCGILSWSTEAISSQPVTRVTAPKATVQGT